jgi:hypothetical protein
MVDSAQLIMEPFTRNGTGRQTWRTFLTNHAQQLIAADFFVVPTATYRLLFVLMLARA